MPTRLLLIILLVVLLPLSIAACLRYAGDGPAHWSQARWDSSGLAPDPAEHPESIIQVYAADAWGWKGLFGVHTWIILKPENASAYERYDVVGWGVARGAPAVRRNLRPPDGYWAGSKPELVAEVRGEAAALAIPRVETAIANYPFNGRYRTWPGPNSNSFIAHIAREVPALGAALPAKAVGKDFLPGWRVLARAPSGTGLQLQLYGLLGVTLALKEGVELNLLGFIVGVDFMRPALKLPGLGRLGVG